MDVRLVDNDLPAQSSYIEGAELVHQRLGLRLAQWKGEWLLRASDGIDYLSLLEQKPPDTDGIADLLRAEILSTPGVQAVEDLDVSFTASTQTISASGIVVVDEEQLTLEVSVPWAIGGLVNTNAAVTLRRGGGSILP